MSSRLFIILAAGVAFFAASSARGEGSPLRPASNVAPAPAPRAPSSSSARASAAASLTSPTLILPPAGNALPIDAAGVDRLIHGHGKRLLVVNYWATWCAPCVAEIPHFEGVYNEFRTKGVLFVGLSGDFVDSWKTTVPPFLKEKKVTYPNFVLDVDANEFIPAIDKDWSGSLPATFYYDAKGNRLGHRFGIVEKGVLEADIRRFLGAESSSKP